MAPRRAERLQGAIGKRCAVQEVLRRRCTAIERSDVRGRETEAVARSSFDSITEHPAPAAANYGFFIYGEGKAQARTNVAPIHVVGVPRLAIYTRELDSTVDSGETGHGTAKGAVG